jgi:large subunit ribosomal protein L4e
MFAPLKIWRRWHRKTNTNQNRHAVASALAASACASLVWARGHRIDSVPELPLVVDNLNVEKTSALLSALQAAGASADLHRARTQKRTRAGQGKMRNSRFVLRKGPLIVYGDANEHLRHSARNLPGVDICHVNRLNLLQLAPGGHLGRFTVFTQDAFEALNNVFGTYRARGIQKSGYQLNRNSMNIADLARIINSDQVQSKLRFTRGNGTLHHAQHGNPLKNRVLMQRLNPGAKALREAAAKANEARSAARKAALKQKRSKSGRKAHAARIAAHTKLESDLTAAFGAAAEKIRLQDEAGRYIPQNE